MGREHTASARRRHGTIGAAQIALTALVVGGVALAALLLRPGTGLSAKGRGPLGGNAVLVVGLALLALLGGFWLREKYREQIRAVRGLDPVEQRVVDVVSRVLPVASLVVPLLVLALHRFGSSGGPEAEHRRGDGPTASPSPRPAPMPDLPTGEHAEHGSRLELTPILLGLGIVLVVVLVVIVVVVGLYLWRVRARPPVPEAPAALGDERERLTRAVDSGRRALLDGTDARAAVIACYASMEESLAASGVARRASDSPQDLLERAAAGGLPARAAVVELTALFREARYSTHPMDDGHRDRAAAALAEIADGLRARASGPEAVAGAS
ncbi:DUF4129 domain-containing protein [Streptomyces sp. LaBMicrA B280]|uniref:DUF4129 domain-containing protein n=1 Tax=Streptomyces sp. LaBMicrA B280 TaxID=3391001 RepID=UPI003BA5BFB7